MLFSAGAPTGSLGTPQGPLGPVRAELLQSRGIFRPLRSISCTEPSRQPKASFLSMRSWRSRMCAFPKSSFLCWTPRRSKSTPTTSFLHFPTPVRSYLLTWHLIFDAFGAAVPKVRSDYLDHLKTENYVGPLLEFMFDVLGHSGGSPPQSGSRRAHGRQGFVTTT